MDMRDVLHTVCCSALQQSGWESQLSQTASKAAACRRPIYNRVMPKVIKSVKVNDQQLAILLEHKDKQFELKKEVHADIFPALVEGLRQIRELTQNMAIIAGAIAAFTIPVVNTSFVQTKPFAYLALVLQFITIGYAIYHLVSVITKEVNELSRQHSTFMTLIDQEIDRVNEIIESGDIDKLVHTDSETQEILDRLDGLKTVPEPDKSLDRLKFLLIGSLLALSLSFLPLNLYTDGWSHITSLWGHFSLSHLCSYLPK